MLPKRFKNLVYSLKYYILFFVVISLFFLPIFKGYVPFPGDLLVSFYEPYKAYPVLNYENGAAVPTKNQDTDVARHIFPWKSFSTESIKKGEIPFWDPHNFSGNPLMANFQSAVFYPINLIFLLLPFLSAWTLYIFISPVLAAVFTFLFLREIKLSKIASCFGGLVFALSSYMVVWLEYGNIDHTFMWLPLGLLFTEKIIKGDGIRNNLYLIAALFMSILAGYIQGFFYILTIIFVYYLAKNFQSKSFSFKKFIIFISTLIFPVFLTLFQTLPTLELFKLSTRSNYSLDQIKNLLNPWWYSITVVAPNFFGNPASNNHWFYGTYIERVSYFGTIPFILATFAVLNFKKRKEILIFAGIGILSFILSLDILFTKYFFQIPIPVLSTTVPTRMLSVFEFCGAILAAIGFDFLREKYNKKLFTSIVFVFVIIIISWIFVFSIGKIIKIDPINISISKKNLIVPSVIILLFSGIIFAWFRKFKFSLVLIFVLTLIELFYFFDKITPFSPKEFVYPNTPVISFLQKNAGINRFWGYGSGYIESDFQTYDNTFSPEGVDPIHIVRYATLLQASANGKLSATLARPDANLAPGFGSTNFKDNKYRQRLLNLLGVRYVLNKFGSDSPDFITFPDGVYRFIYHDGAYQIYENKEALPRIFLASKYTVEKNDQKILDKIFDTNFQLSQNIILEENLNPAAPLEKDNNAKVKINSYENNSVSISVSSKTNMLLFLSDTYAPGWKAEIDGKETRIYRADFAFRAVVVPSGSHVVVFSYIPESFILGLRISLVSLLLLVILFIVLKSYEKKK